MFMHGSTFETILTELTIEKEEKSETIKDYLGLTSTSFQCVEFYPTV